MRHGPELRQRQTIALKVQRPTRDRNRSAVRPAARSQRERIPVRHRDGALVGEAAAALDAEAAAAQAGIDRARIDDPARSPSLVGGVEHRIGAGVVDRQVRAQRQNGERGVIIVEIVVVIGVADVQGRVVDGLPTLGIDIRTLPGEVDRSGARAVDAGQRQPVRNGDRRARRRQVHRAVIGHTRQRTARKSNGSTAVCNCRLLKCAAA